jgi:hypothetical protein
LYKVYGRRCGCARGRRSNRQIAGDDHRWIGELDSVLIESLFDEGEGASSDRELFARFGRDLEPDLNGEIAERFDALHFQRLENMRREFRIVLKRFANVFDDAPDSREIRIVRYADLDLVDNPIARIISDRR